MRHENECVSSGFVMRIVSGLLAFGGILALGATVLRLFSEGWNDWWSMALAVASSYGIYLFGRYAITGRLAIGEKHRNAG